MSTFDVNKFLDSWMTPMLWTIFFVFMLKFGGGVLQERYQSQADVAKVRFEMVTSGMSPAEIECALNFGSACAIAELVEQGTDIVAASCAIRGRFGNNQTAICRDFARDKFKDDS